MNDLNIIIKAELAKSTPQDINKQLENIADKIDKLKIKIDIDPKTLQTIKDFNVSIKKVDDVIKANSISVENLNKDFIEQKQHINILGKEYSSLGDVIKKHISLNEELEESRRTTSYKPGAGVKVDITQAADGSILSGSIQDTTASLGKLIGKFDELKSAEVDNMQVSRALSQIYRDREIREVSLNDVTGQWTATITENAKQNLVLKGVLDQSTGGLYRQKEALTQVRNVNLGFMEQLKVAITRIPIWMIGMTAFYQTLRFFTNGVKYVNDLNKALTEISIVTGQSQTQVSALGMEYQRLAKDMAVTTKEITQASVTFYRQGLSQAEVMERVRVATQYAKVANVDFAQSSEILTATVNSMGISIQRASDVMTYLGEFKLPPSTVMYWCKAS